MNKRHKKKFWKDHVLVRNKYGRECIMKRYMWEALCRIEEIMGLDQTFIVMKGGSSE